MLYAREPDGEQAMASFTTLLSSLDTLCASSLSERQVALEELCHRLGGDWAAGTVTLEEDSLPLRHLPTGLEFLAIPGGEFEMGLTEEDLKAESEFVDWTSGMSRDLEDKRKRAPVFRCAVRPFLTGRALLEPAMIQRLTKGAYSSKRVPFGVAFEIARETGFRLPRESELEWVLREGGKTSLILQVATYYRAREPWLLGFGGTKPDFEQALRSRFGLTGLNDPQWATQDRNGRDDTSRIVCGGDAMSSFDVPGQAIGALAANRAVGKYPALLRFGMDCPLG